MAFFNNAMSTEAADTSLANVNFRLAADWERHESTVIAFPDHHHPRFSGRSLPSFTQLRKEITLIFKHISHYEKVKIIGSHKTLPKQKEIHGDAQAYSKRTQEVVEFWDHRKTGINMDIRYSSPLAVSQTGGQSSMFEPRRVVIANKVEAPTANAKHGEKDAQSFSFDWEYCQDIIEEEDERRLITLDISYDSSAFAHDGAGTFILSTALLHMWPQNQVKPSTARELVQINMEKYMEAENFIWIEQTPEETDRPLSSMVRFVCPGHVILSRPAQKDENFPWMEFSLRALNTLRHYKNNYGKSAFEFTVIEEAHPSFITDSRKRKITRCHEEEWPLLSYLTYIHVENGILFPVFGHTEADENARAVLKSVFGDTCDIVDSVRVNELPWWGSSLHSITHHVPFDSSVEQLQKLRALNLEMLRDRSLGSIDPGFEHARRQYSLELRERDSNRINPYDSSDSIRSLRMEDLHGEPVEPVDLGDGVIETDDEDSGNEGGDETDIEWETDSSDDGDDKEKWEIQSVQGTSPAIVEPGNDGKPGRQDYETSDTESITLTFFE